MRPALETGIDPQILDDPYETFMQRHLRHYGLFTGRNAGCQGGLAAAGSWERSRGYLLPDVNSQDTNGSASDTEGDKEGTRKTPYSLLLEQALLKTRQLVFDAEGGRRVPRLRAPRGLFAIPSRQGPSQGPRWPVECEVIKEEVRHIEWEPAEPEEFYQLTGFERTPLCVGEERGTVVYCIDSATKSPYFTGARAGGSRGPARDACPSSGKGSADSALAFESRFESGNLQKAVRVGLHDYELTLRADLYTTKHTQWYYFRVRNMKAGVTYRFTIVNLMKPSSLYNMGMKPLLYSEQEARARGVGWRRAGANIRYYRNQRDQEGQSLYSLTWTCQFPHEGDTCYFAQCYPYTFSDLQLYLARVANHPVRARHCKFRVLCRSLAGNPVYVLTITSPSPSPAASLAKRAVVVTARVHPGETNSSWMMAGFLDFLLGDSPDAQLLRDTFVFKVVPMLNPDGVIVGNYRCSLAGRDLNRNYGTLLRDAFPCVWHTRNMVKRLVAEREVVLYCDFHGHSRKHNVFMYGCDNKSSPAQRLLERVFPLMMSKNATDMFSYKGCKFRVQKSKEGTGRIVMWRMGITNSYTMESTFGGSTLGGRKGTHFTTQDLKSLGYYFCDTLLDYCDPDQSKTYLCMKELCEMLHQEIRKKLENLGREADSSVALSDVSVSDIESSTSGSNSTESDGLPAHLLDLAHKFTQKKKHLRTRKERNRLRLGHVQSREQKALRGNMSLPSSAALLADQGMKREAQEKPGSGTSQERKIKKVQHIRTERNRTGRAWIPHPSTGIAVIGEGRLWDSNQEKNAYLEAVTAAYLRSGGMFTAAQQTVTAGEFEWASGSGSRQRQRSLTSQRRPLAMASIQQHRTLEFPGRDRGAPLRQHPLPFDWELEVTTRRQPAVRRGRTPSAYVLPSSLHRPPTLATSQVVQSRVVPEFPVSNGLVASRSSSSISAPAPGPKPSQESRVRPARVSVRYLSHETATSSSDTLETNKSTQERPSVSEAFGLDGVGSDRGHPKPDRAVRRPAVDTQTCLPDLKRQDSGPQLQGQRCSRSAPEDVAADLGPLAISCPRAPQQPERAEPQRERMQKLQRLSQAKLGRPPPPGGARGTPRETGREEGRAGSDVRPVGSAPSHSGSGEGKFQTVARSPAPEGPVPADVPRDPL
ncbi:cytosolic carboxypeptidase 2 isoform X2 [Lepisosteus oculatus]|uniref:cytosolic carboxypeptidase 2 isoform X2 n=1 Tax=Lepisosteus oculatus TaxID=7918 RepID=UPI0035F522E7